jgi:hypothetical protein
MKKNINIPNEIDDAFFKAIDSMEMEPSEKFWGKVDAGLTQADSIRKILFWKRASIVLSSLLIIGGIATFFHFDNHVLTQKEITVEVVKEQSISQDQVSVSTQPDHIKVEQAVVAANKNAPKAIVLEQQPYQKTERHPVLNTDLPVQKAAPVQQQNNSLDSKQNIPSVVSGLPSEKAGSKQTDAVSVKPDLRPEDQNVVLQEVKQAAVKARQDSMAVKKENSDSLENILPAGNEMAAETPLNPAEPAAPVSTLRLYVEGIFSPELTTHFLKDNNSSDLIQESDLLDQENERVSFSSGIRVGYDINKWSLQSGILYATQSIAIKPQTLYPDASAGYSYCTLLTSNGTVDIPYSENQQAGDSIELRGNSFQKLGFISIPLQVRYFLGGSKFSFYALSGISASILVKQETDFSMGEDDEERHNVISGIEGAKKVYYGYTLGVGARYMFRRGLYLGIEPNLRGAMSSSNKNTPVKTYPFSLGFGIIAGFHF